jgi:hypothetical protein
MTAAWARTRPLYLAQNEGEFLPPLAVPDQAEATGGR